MNYQEQKAKILKLIQEDSYLPAFRECANLIYENPRDSEMTEVCLFLWSRIIEANYDFEPETAEQYHFRGLSKFYKGEVEASIKDYDKALSLKPRMDYVIKTKAFSYHHLGQFEKAIELLNEAIAIKEAGEYYDDLAENYSKLGDAPKTLFYHEKAIQTSPKDPRLWYNYGTHLGVCGEFKKAIQMFDEAIRLWPHYEDAIYNRDHYRKRLKNK